MNPKWRRFAPLGLILALITGIVSLVLAILYQAWGLPLQISLALFLVGLAIYGVLDPDKVRRIFTGRQARHGSNALVMTLAFIGILVAVNYLIYQIARLYPEITRRDMTESKENSLAPETLDVLAKLPDTVKAQAFFTKSNSVATTEELLKRYSSNSKGKFIYEVIDPDEKPVAAQEAGIPQGKDGVVSLQMGSRRELVESASEQTLTSALIRLFSNEKRVVYFLTGHGEHSPEDTGDASYATVKKNLEDRNYSVKILNLRATLIIPEDAKLIVIAGPNQQPVSEDEVKLISDYVANGGALIIMEDPLIQTKFGDAVDPLASYLSQSWGINLGMDVIIQVAGNQHSPYIQGFDVGNHPITANIVQNSPPVFPVARSVTAQNAPEGVQTTELVLSMPFSENCYPYCSWASTDLNDVNAWLSGQQELPANPTTDDYLGPVPVSVAAENSTTGSRVVIYGDSDFPDDGFYSTYGNGDLFINSVDWATGQESMINLTTQSSTQRMLVPPFSTSITSNLLFLILVLGLPGGVIVAGVLAWLARRRRG